MTKILIAVDLLQFRLYFIIKSLFALMQLLLSRQHLLLHNTHVPNILRQSFLGVVSQIAQVFAQLVEFLLLFDLGYIL